MHFYNADTWNSAHGWKNLSKIQLFTHFLPIITFFTHFLSCKPLGTHFFGFLEIFWAENDCFYQFLLLSTHQSPEISAKTMKKWCSPPPLLGNGQFFSIGQSFFHWLISDVFVCLYGSISPQNKSGFGILDQGFAWAWRLVFTLNLIVKR